jgi:hypothetical protein
MATIRKKRHKWEVQIRRVGLRPVSKSFYQRKDADAWARHMEVQADRRDLPPDMKELERVTLGELVARYRDTISIKKRTVAAEQIVLNAFLRHPICSRTLSTLRTEDFASYRDDRLQDITPASLKRSLAPKIPGAMAFGLTAAPPAPYPTLRPALKQITLSVPIEPIQGGVR